MKALPTFQNKKNTVDSTGHDTKNYIQLKDEIEALI